VEHPQQHRVLSTRTVLKTPRTSGNGKWSKKDRKKFFEGARGSSLECASCLDMLVAKRRISTDRVIEGKEQLRGIVNLLTKTIKNLSEDS